MSDAATDAPTPQDTEPNLEDQVEELLSDVMQTVEEINRKLDDGPDEEPDEEAALGDGGAESRTPPPTAAARAGEEKTSMAESPEPATGNEPSVDDQDEAGADNEELEAIGALEADLEAAIAAVDGDETPTEPEGELPVPEYGDMDSLDDELAALASHALDEDLLDQPPPAAEAPAAPVESAPIVVAPSQPESPSEPEPDVEPEPEPDAAPPPRPKARPAPARWGWLPAKPAWEPVYSRWRPLIAAWRHAVWILPPLTVFVGRWLLAKARHAEPYLLQAATTIASPLSKRDAKVRSAIGWLACWTAFWSASLWVYVLFARSPSAPETSGTPTTLAGGQTVASSDAKP
ncbi:MAG: hypothetical protein H6810_04170 [Phycisphaeraceae bacterium]|nr:MAG: hypothetical protein H6810_04170 [Phycisphaeraceae bacterium]